jgi:hypothetical protein
MQTNTHNKFGGGGGQMLMLTQPLRNWNTVLWF